jgi:hypothetical protein
VSAGGVVTATLGAEVPPDDAVFLSSLPHDAAISPSVTVVITTTDLLINPPTEHRIGTVRDPPNSKAQSPAS